MRSVLHFSILLSIALALGTSLTHATPTPFNEQQNFFHVKARPGVQMETETIIDKSNREMEMGTRNSFQLMDNLASGQARAQEIIQTIQNEELKAALEKITKRGKEKFESDPDLRNPAIVIGGALALWMGRTFHIFKTDGFRLSSRVEGRGRQGEFFMESPLLNGKVLFNPNDGLSIQMNRRISSVNSNAEVYYHARSKAITTQLRHPLAPHIDFTFGATQNLQNQNPFDGRAGIEYRLSF